MSSTTTATTWPTLPVAALTTHTPAVEADPQLIESVQETGVQEPLYVATLDDDTYRVIDGVRRLAAAVAAQLTEVPVTYRPVIRVDALTRHPGNVRRDLRITKAFRASIRERGVRTAIQIRRTGEGVLQVVEGHRRLAAAIAEGLTHVPYTYDEVSDADAYLDMVTTAVHRDGLSDAEQAMALFQAAELGASAKKMAAAAGRTQKEAKTLARLGGSETVAKVATAAASLTLADMEALAELETAAPDLASDVQAAIAQAPDERHDWRIRDAQSRARRRREAAAHRAELEAAGAQFRTLAELSPKAAPVRTLRDVSHTEHADCKGEVWVLEHETATRYVRYCSNTVLYGHKVAGRTDKPDTAARKRIITGNGHWDASTTVRREWLAAYLQRKSHPRAEADIMLRIAATAMLTPDGIVQSKQTHPKRDSVLGDLLGIPEGKRHSQELAKRAANARRSPAHLFAAVAACYELWIPRTAWRTDGNHGRAAVRVDAARYLGWLQELGYEPTPIETAVLTGVDYDPARQAPVSDGQADADEPPALDD